MNEEIKVTVAKDDGHKNRWALGKFIYRQERDKKSLNTKVVVGLIASLMIFGALYSVTEAFFRANPGEFKSPFSFNETPGASAPIDVAKGQGLKRAKPPKSQNRKKQVFYSGLEIVARPNAGVIPPGLFVKAKLISGALSGPVKAVLEENLTFNGEEYAPEGTFLVGSGSSGKNRLIIRFNKMLFKDGTVQKIQAQACDFSDQTAGLKGKRLSRYAMLLAAGVGLNFLGGVSEGLEETQVQNGVATKKSDLRNAMLNGASKAAFEQSKDVMTDFKEEKTVIQVDKDTEFYVLFEGE